MIGQLCLYTFNRQTLPYAVPIRIAANVYSASMHLNLRPVKVARLEVVSRNIVYLMQFVWIVGLLSCRSATVLFA